MNVLRIENVLNSPDIFGNPETHLLEIRGESYPENAREFFRPVTAWIHDYLEQFPKEEFRVNLDLKYFNSSTAKILFNMFQMLDAAAAEGKPVTLNWIYDRRNLNAVEYGEDFQEDLAHIRFQMTPKI